MLRIEHKGARIKGGRSSEETIKKDPGRDDNRAPFYSRGCFTERRNRALANRSDLSSPRLSLDTELFNYYVSCLPLRVL